jgi:hypothetical protein
LNPEQPRKWSTRFVSFFFESKDENFESYLKRFQSFSNEIPLTIFLNSKEKKQIEKIPQNVEIIEFSEQDLSLRKKYLEQNVGNVRFNENINLKNFETFIETISKFFIISRNLERWKEEKIFWMNLKSFEKIFEFQLIEIDEYLNHEGKFEMCISNFVSSSRYKFQVNGNFMGKNKNSWKKVSRQIIEIFETSSLEEIVEENGEEILGRLDIKNPNSFRLWYGDENIFLESFRFPVSNFDKVCHLFFESSNDKSNLLFSWNVGKKLIEVV